MRQLRRPEQRLLYRLVELGLQTWPIERVPSANNRSKRLFENGFSFWIVQLRFHLPTFLRLAWKSDLALNLEAPVDPVADGRLSRLWRHADIFDPRFRRGFRLPPLRYSRYGNR